MCLCATYSPMMSDFDPNRPSTSKSNERPGLFDTFNHNDDGTGSEPDIDMASDVSDFDDDTDVSDVESTHSTDSAGFQALPAVGGAAGANSGPWNVVQPPEDVAQLNLPQFSVRDPGPRHAPARNSDPILYFDLYFDNEMYLHIVRETNRYARWFLSNEAVVEWLEEHPKSRFHSWPENGINVVKLKQYFGLALNMGLIRKKKLTEYWTTKSSQRTPYFGSVMGQKAFLLISRMLHVSNRSTEKARGDDGYDPWQKVRPVLDRLNASFKRFYVPSQFVSIDESMIGMKNRVVYIQYMPNKRHARFGIKKFELCDSNGYVLHVEMYAGKDFDVNKDDGLAHGVVMKLMREGQILGKGYHLFTDNFYTKPKLAEELFQHDTLLTGTIRGNSRGLSTDVAKAKLNVGETLYARKGAMLAVAFRDKKTLKKPVLLLTTAHTAENVIVEKRGKEFIKPAMVLDYNMFMGGVDVGDKKVCHVAAERATHRYWVKIFRNLMDISITNAYEIYQLNTDAPNRLSKHDFIVSIVEALCSSTMATEPRVPGHPSVPVHRLVLLPGRNERECAVCSDRKGTGRRRSRHWCPGCDVGCHELCEPRLEHYKRKRGGRKRRAEAADE